MDTKFTTPCSMRTTTPENRQLMANILEKIGYECLYTPSGDDNLISCYDGCFATDYKSHPACYYCGENEELFLALAALRDDSDYAQWFVCEDYGVPVFEQCNKQYAMSDFIISHWTDYHKATKEELIAHFTNK